MTAIAARAYATGVVSARFILAADARKIVDGLKTALHASVVLHDAEKHEHHLARSGDRWLSIQTTATDEPRLCYVASRINDRWTLYICSRRRLHPDAQSLADWAADKLAPYMPRKTADEPASPPFGGGGGSPGGSAEIGIPVWWARKARN